MAESVLFSKSETPLWKTVTITVAIEIALAVATILLSDHSKAHEIADLLRAIKNKHGLPFLFVAVCFAAPVGEELIFRGGLPWLLEKIFRNRPLAVAVSSGLWAGLHGGTTVNRTIVSISGINYSFLRYKSDSLWPTIWIHIANNTVVFVIAMMAGAL